MDHGAFNSNKIYFVLITKLIKYRKKLTKITAKSLKKQDNRQRQIFQISHFSVPKCF